MGMRLIHVHAEPFCVNVWEGVVKEYQACRFMLGVDAISDFTYAIGLRVVQVGF
jgi:hypothetical protein